jgi:hypothetical protein
MIDRIKGWATAILAVLAVSWGVAWGFRHLVTRHRIRQEVAREKRKPASADPRVLDSCADALFR